MSGLLYLSYLYLCEDDWCFHYEWQKIKNTNSFGECLARGFPTVDTLPRVCYAGNKIFEEE